MTTDDTFPAHVTDDQAAAIINIHVRYRVSLHPADWHPAFDLPPGYVAGWVGGPEQRLYIGVSPEGDISS